MIAWDDNSNQDGRNSFREDRNDSQNKDNNLPHDENNFPEDQDEFFEYPISNVLDLHTFHPKDVKDLLNEYIIECRKRNILKVRIVHGKGKSVMKKMVHSALEKHTDVLHYEDAGPGSGGWGASFAYLRGIDG